MVGGKMQVKAAQPGQGHGKARVPSSGAICYLVGERDGRKGPLEADFQRSWVILCALS